MANIFTSSIGKKLIMSISGLFLIVFLLLHLTINALSLISEEAFQAGCDFMALPIITVMVPVLALGFIIHIIYGFYLSATNLKARGKERYAVAHKGAADNWASKNMLVLGIIVLGVLGFHLTHFWADMQLLQFQGVPHEELANPNVLLLETFKSPVVVVVYVVWFAALWFHLTHGFWSAFHTIGWNNDTWIKRLKVLSYVFATIIFVGFTAVAVVACLKANELICACC
ncbi:MAG: succinate dehydrogenase cytochrome b subunit [Bacteroidales bacterium]|nr:succinate dehydrogenase cytochrome b subunit [Bacteroidales bacterium]MBO7764369.1 succinate dehydrogenase cytochrome b subunit [Bacteroidales bacterium]